MVLDVERDMGLSISSIPRCTDIVSRAAEPAISAVRYSGVHSDPLVGLRYLCEKNKDRKRWQKTQ